MEDSDNESGGHNSDGGGAGNGDFSSPREQDLLLPIANVSRIMKRALPANAKISKDAKETMQECVSEYISFITGEASDKCQREKRKTVNSEDLLWAMASLGFEDYVEPLKLYLQKFRELEGDKGSAAAAASQSQHLEGSENEGFSGAGMMMMRQKLFGTSSSPIYHPRTAGGGGNSSSSSGIGRHRNA